MIYHATVVLSLCICLLTGMPVLTARAQGPNPAASAKPKSGTPQPAATADEAKAPTAADEEPPYPAPAASEEEAEGAVATPPQSASAQVTTQADTKKELAESKADKERCAQLMAQGQAALAQAEGCGGGDQPIWAGSIVSFSQTTAPAWRTFPNANNPFYALGLYVAPRLTLTEKWALNADISLAYEATIPDDTTRRHKVQWSDVRVTANGNLGSIGGFTFTGGPRLVAPTSKMSYAAEARLGTGALLNVIKTFDLLDGLALIVGGGYTHTWASRLTPKIVEDGEKPECATAESRDSLTTCAAGNTRVVQDSFRASGAASLNFTPKLNMQLSYVYGWSLVKPFPDTQVTIDPGSGSAESTTNVIDATRWRRFGSLGLSFSYQPATWFIASVQGSTSVCYTSPYGGQSALGGGCSGGLATSSPALRNPIANKFSNLGLQFTIPIDALYDAMKSNSGEAKTARVKRGARL